MCAFQAHLTMKGDQTVIKYLNKVLYNELTAINQYFMHYKILEDQGFVKLAKKSREESIEEMNHADELMSRILFLEGLPNLQSLGQLRIGESVKEMLQCDLALEYDAVPVLREGIQYCEEVRDYVSRDLLQKILDDEEEHIDWLETQLGLIKQVGEQNYLQAQL